MKTRIHVNKHKIASNLKHGTNEPVITAKTYKDNRYGHQAVIKCSCGQEAAKVVYATGEIKPLSCGARVWIETENEVIVE